MPNLATTPPVQLEVFAPATRTPSNGKSIVVAYGTEGLNAPFGQLITDYCHELAKAGYTAVVPHYFQITATTPGTNSVSSALTAANIDRWAAAVGEAVKWCETSQGNDNVGLAGFSLGAFIAVHAALVKPVKAIVDFFGPMTKFGLMAFPTGSEITSAKAAGLPPTQIHHGPLDIIVMPSESTTLESWMTTAGRLVDLHTNYVGGHPGQPKGEWTAADQAKATPRTITFFDANVP